MASTSPAAGAGPEDSPEVSPAAGAGREVSPAAGAGREVSPAPGAGREGGPAAGAIPEGGPAAGGGPEGGPAAGAIPEGGPAAGGGPEGGPAAGDGPEGGPAGGDGVDLWHHGDEDLDPDDPGQLDLAVNVRLPRPPDWLRARLHGALDGLAAYPRPDAAVAAVARRHGRLPEEVLLTNGAAEAFTLIARALRPQYAVCVHPSFTAPEAALRDAGHEVRRVLLELPFMLAADDVPDDADLVVLGNPTNPTGRLHPVSVLERLARPGRVLVVDEAFADAIPGEPASLSGRHDLPGVLVIRSLTKAWGLAGLRVGYVLGEPALLAALRHAQPPWPVNGLALTVLEACSQPEAVAWVGQQAATTAGWRQALAGALDQLPGVEVPAGGQAPFLLVRVADATAVRRRLRELDIAVRRGDTFPGLGDQWLRIAVVGPEHHARIVDAFARAVGPEPFRSDSGDGAEPAGRTAPPGIGVTKVTSITVSAAQGETTTTTTTSVTTITSAAHYEAKSATGTEPAAGDRTGTSTDSKTRASSGTSTGSEAHADSGTSAGAGSSGTGFVTLIGAGPGGADLITVRGWRALHAADVVVADRLADPVLTGELRPGVVLIDAGKSPGAQQLTQDEINQVLIEHAGAGRRVARLKGGDPFVFGRGGEEAAACAAAGIPCSVIPGLSSATAGPALAGIPLTHRELSQSFSVVSGHLPPGHPASRIDWGALAAGTDTLVLLMAVRNLPVIAAHLLALGRAGTTPAACVESAGTAAQRVRRTTLGDLAGPPADEPPVRNPAIIVIGATAGNLDRPG
jgi:histidinol-phosphate aminotransferase